MFILKKFIFRVMNLTNCKIDSTQAIHEVELKFPALHSYFYLENLATLTIFDDIRIISIRSKQASQRCLCMSRIT